MPINQLKNLPKVSEVTAGAEFTVDAPVGTRSYKEFVFDTSGSGALAKAQVKNLEIMLNTKTVQRFNSAAQMELINGFYNRQVVANEIRFPFYRDEFRQHADAMEYVLGAANLESIQVKGEIDGAATTPALSAYAARQQVAAELGSEKAIIANQLGIITKVKKFRYTPTGSGEYQIKDLPVGPGAGAIMAMHFITASDNIDAVSVQVDDVTVWDNVSTTRMEQFLEGYGRTRQANCYHIDFLYEGKSGNELQLALVQELLFTLTMSGSDTIDLYVELRDTF